jgi:hypothetical protein
LQDLFCASHTQHLGSNTIGSTGGKSVEAQTRSGNNSARRCSVASAQFHRHVNVIGRHRRFWKCRIVRDVARICG